MDLDDRQPAAYTGQDDTVPDEITALHHSAFEQLRQSTLSDEEAFLARMRCWEASAVASSSPPGVQNGTLAPPGSPVDPRAAISAGSFSLMSELITGTGQGAGPAGGVGNVEHSDDEEEEVDFVLDTTTGTQPIPLQLTNRPSAPVRPAIEVEELSRRLRAGVGLQDFEALQRPETP
jgi:hypothetical protein